MKKKAEVVVIGGGIIGLSIAYHLAQKRAGRILLFEKGQLGEGSTSRCVGGIRTQFSTEINILFSLLSLQTFEHFKEEFGIDPEFKRIGYLFLATTEVEMEVFKKNVELQRRYNIPVELLDPEEIKKRWPYLRTNDILGGTYCSWDGYAGPSEVLMGFAQGAKRLGVEIHEREEVKEIVCRGEKVQGVKTQKEEIEAPVVVNASGPFASVVGERANVKIPVRPLRRQVFVTAPFNLIEGTIPLTIDFQRGWYFRQELDGFLLSGPLDSYPSFNTHIDYEAMVEASENAIYRVPGLEGARISRGWAGLYEISPDNHAILGSVPELEGFILANGFSGHGFQHSPAVGKVISELIVEGKALTLDISSLSIERFERGQLILEPMTAFKE
ncbi:MAG: NAD(P)/FAD-dependent oxidoreductase [Thermodesulfobacteriota bacterium]